MRQRENIDDFSFRLSFQALLYAALQQPQSALKQWRESVTYFQKTNDVKLNAELSRFEAERLQGQLGQLEQQQAFNALSVERAKLQRNVIIVLMIFASFTLYFIVLQVVNRRNKRSLSIKVKQRTQELEFLMEKLQTANDVKSQFLANMSHEIRTPLTTIIGQSEAIQQLFPDKANNIVNDLKMVREHSLHLLQLTNNILDLSKIEADKIELDIQTHNIHKLLQQLENMFAVQAQDKGIQFSINATLAKPFYLLIDAFRVKQILINLCSNAIKFTDSGEVTLSVTFQQNCLCFKLQDSGIGMSERQLQTVFEMFTQGDSSISRRFGGTGLGLCLSQQLAKMLGGVIRVESELGKGSLFTFNLPCQQKTDFDEINDKARDNTQLFALENVSESPPLQGKILLAEDNADNNRIIARILTGLGLEVITAANGKQVLDLVNYHQPKLILMDIQMPEMDGIASYQQLRQQGCTIPIIALTANVMSNDVEHYKEIGFQGYLAKPIEKEQFFNLIRQYYI